MRRSDVQLRPMSAALETLAELSDPAAAAAEIARIDSLVAHDRDVPDEVWRLVGDMTSRLGGLAVERWKTVDPYLHAVFWRGFAQTRQALERRGAPEARRLLRVGLERMRHALEEITEVSRIDGQDGKELVRWLAGILPIPQQQLAAMLGVDRRKLQRWLNESPRPEGDDALRVAVVARIVNQLRHALTPVGVQRWFDRPHPELGGKRPRALLAQAERLPRLVRLAASMRHSDAA